MILGPLSIATGGYIGIGPGATDYCPLPLAIGSDGYIRLDVEPAFDRRDGDGGTGIRGVILDPVAPVKKGVSPHLVAAALVAIQEYYDG